MLTLNEILPFYPGPLLAHREHLSEKILIQLDTEPQHYAFTPDKHVQ